jgi:NitT/TauT family transport system ATP-binding protein
MFQRPALLPWRTVLENVMLPIELMGGDDAPYQERAKALLETTGLAGFANRLPRELSGGMQQRASLCRSLVYDPEVLLMDEPFAALDALTREELSMELQRICAESGQTVVFVTHSIDEAVILADRVAVMTPRPGRIREIVDVDVPRPRTLGHNAYTEKLSGYAAALRDLLFDTSEEQTS